MKKWLAAGALAVLVLLLIMWRQVNETSAEPPTPRETRSATVSMSPAMNKPANKPAPIDVTKDVELPPPTPEATTPDGKKIMNTGSDDFYRYFIDIIPKRLWKDAAVCYEGKLKSRHRNSKLKLEFDVVVKNGKATIQNTRIAKNEEDGKDVNTIGDPAIESCFFQHVSRYQWDANDDMPEGYVIPDYTYPDMLVIRPERSKKYYKDNMEYVGAEAPPLPSAR